MKLLTAKTVAPYLLIITAFAVYLSTMAPTVYLGDSGELTAGAFALGVPHASGYPLYSLLGKIFCMLPLGNIGFRMNLMSGVFLTLTVWLVYVIILRVTSSALPAVTAALYLAFTPLFWFQCVSAEVYPLHVFFVALMIKLLWDWDKNGEFRFLLLFVFVTGLSFGNHMQTVMLAPGVLFLIISRDKKVLFRFRYFIVITLFFVLALTLYLYLPIRTDAGAAIHWGDPNSLDRFWDHITARTHRGKYIFSSGPTEYLSRTLAALQLFSKQYGILLLFAFWGWLKRLPTRWKISVILVFIFDLLYSVFLNVIAFKFTPFMLPSFVVIAVLMGLGIADALQTMMTYDKINIKLKRTVQFACCLLPAIPFFSGYGLCNQSCNYMAYEHAVNIFRTPEYAGTVFLDGDNNIFPAVYGRLVEGMGDDITVYDRLNLIFRWSVNDASFSVKGKWNEIKTLVEKKIIEEKAEKGVYYAVFDPFSIPLPSEFRAIPYGVLWKVILRGPPAKTDVSIGLWDYYYKESIHDPFQKDFMNRNIRAHYYFLNYAQDLWQAGRIGESLKNLEMASRIAYDDASVHSNIAIFFIKRRLFDAAQQELEKAMLYQGHANLSGIFNNWGYFYHEKGEYEMAAAHLQKALQESPNNLSYLNNIGFALYEAGKKEAAREAFEKSLTINKDQPDIKAFMKKKGLQIGKRID